MYDKVESPYYGSHRSVVSATILLVRIDKFRASLRINLAYVPHSVIEELILGIGYVSHRALPGQ